MKRFIALLLVLVFLPVFAFCEKDPIIGLWYTLYEKDKFPESFWDYFEIEQDRMFGLYDFTEKNEIFIYDFLIDGLNSKPETEFHGTWEKTDDGYLIHTFGSGDIKAILADGCLLYELPNSTIYARFRPVESFDWMNDYIREEAR